MQFTYREIAAYSVQLPFAALAAGPQLRCAAEWTDAAPQNGERAITVDRVSAQAASAKGLCLSIPSSTEEIVVVTVQGLSNYGTAEEAADTAMWWVDRSLSSPPPSTQASVSDGGEGTRVLCCLRLKEVRGEKVYLYSAADVGVSAEMSTTVRRLRVPRCPFTLQLSRLVELRTLQVSPSVSRLVTELDVGSCLRWLPAEVHSFLSTLEAPLRGVRVTTVSLSPLALLQRFHASLRVLHLYRRSTAVFHDPMGPFMFEDEELEEEESRSDPTPPGVLTMPPVKLPARAAPPSQGTRLSHLRTRAAAPTSALAPARRTRLPPPPRPRRQVLCLPLGVVPVLEELHIANSVRRRLPGWVAQCRRLRRISLTECCYKNVDALRNLVLQEVSLERCNAFAAFDFFCDFPQLRVLAMKHCDQLRSIAWLPRLSGALRSLTLHHLLPTPLLTESDATAVGNRLNQVEVLNVSIRDLRKLYPLVCYAASTLRELTLFTCLSLSDFAALPRLPSLEKVSVTGNGHMQNLKWLSYSPLVTVVRATQCTQLTSLEGLEACSQLRVLEVTGAHELQDISAVATCAKLFYLDLSQCFSLASVTVLRHLSCLRCVLLRNCVRLPKNFDWLAGCPAVMEVMLPNGQWFDAASKKLQALNRQNTVVLR